MTLGAALPSVASATDYCVYPNENCGADNVKTSEDALAQSAAVDNPDRIFLGADTYTAPTQSGFTYSNATGRLEIIGSGRGPTVVTGPSPRTWSVLYLAGGPGSSVSDLTVRIPANVPLDANGLSLQSTARRIEVVEAGPQVDSHRGVLLGEGAVLEDSSVTLDDAQGTIGAMVVYLHSQPPKPPNVLRGSVVRAASALDIRGDATIERSQLIGGTNGITAVDGTTRISDSLVPSHRHSGHRNSCPNLWSRAGHEHDHRRRHGREPSSLDVTGVAATALPAPAENVHLTFTNSLIRGAFTPLFARALGTGSATISASYSDYNAGGNVSFGGVISESNITNAGGGIFDEAPGREYRLAASSPLIDMGDPAAPQGLDLDGNPRVADGNDDGIARRDIGAFELQPAMAGPPSGGGPSGGPAADTKAPLISGFRSTRAAFAVARAATPRAALVARGTTLRYTLSESARVALKVQRKRGARYRSVGTLRRSGRSGPNRIGFTGRIGRRALRPGSYRAVMTATDAAGNRSAPKVARFRVVR